MDIYRTPDARFESLPDYPYEPAYREWQGMRLAHVDVGGDGGGETIVLLHGEPTWGFLWRKVLPPLLEAGHRCVVPDLPGFGRSDKPRDVSWYSYDRMTEAFSDLFESLGLDDVTLVVHDWGGPIGLRAATSTVRDRVSRLVAMDTAVFTGHQKMSDNWLHFRDFVAGNEDLPITPLVGGGCFSPPPEEVLAAYDAPFPEPAAKAGPRAMPGLIPLTPDSPGAAAGREASEALKADTRPHLLLWADSDPVLPLEAGHRAQAQFPTAAPLTVVESAGHFLQEDRGEHVGELIAYWLEGA